MVQLLDLLVQILAAPARQNSGFAVRIIMSMMATFLGICCLLNNNYSLVWCLGLICDIKAKYTLGVTSYTYHNRRAYWHLPLSLEWI